MADIKRLMKGENIWDSHNKGFAHEVIFPLFASPKIDGIRGAVQEDGKVYSYTGKPIKNIWTSEILSNHNFIGLDFEFTVGAANAADVFQKTTSGIMTIKGDPEFTVNVFDDFTVADKPFSFRYHHIKERVSFLNDLLENASARPFFKLVHQQLIHNECELLDFELSCIDDGFEGVMLRGMNTEYKFGRATLRQQNLLKLKRFDHDEAIVIGFEEEMENLNESQRDAYGKAFKRNTKGAKSGKGRLGKLICKRPMDGAVFRVSATTMKVDEREFWWTNRDRLIGLICRYKHLPHGVVDLPRHPMWAGFRDENDVDWWRTF